MEYQQFLRCITDRLQAVLGDRYRVECRPVCKNNGVQLDGLLLSSGQNGISPTVYLNTYYEQFQRSRPIDEIVWEILRLLKSAPEFGKFDLDQFTDFSAVRKNIAIKLINYDANRELLSGIPHRRFLDLAEVYYFVLRSETLGSATVLIRNEHLHLWQASEKTLHRIGMNNTIFLGWEIRPMNAIIRDYLREELNEYMKEKEPQTAPAPDRVEQLAEDILQRIYQTSDDGPLYVLSNTQRFFGASCMLYTDRLQEFAEAKGSDLYILPSSIHEVILIPQDISPQYESLCRMVREINESEVEPCDRLSDRVYRFSRETGRIS